MPGPLFNPRDQFRFVCKETDQKVTNSTTLVDDAELTIQVEANKIYDVKLVIAYSSDTATPDLDFKLVAPTAATYAFNLVRYYDQKTIDFDTNDELTTNTESRELIATAQGILRTGANAGSFKLTWAQHAATAEDTYVLAGSYLRIKEV